MGDVTQHAPARTCRKVAETSGHPGASPSPPGWSLAQRSAHEVYPASFVRDHRCHARRVEPDETRAAASCHLPDERTRAEVKHVEFAVGERADEIGRAHV